jgi:uncharacterized glyoxalase superfamily protein PhnB
VSAVRCGDGAAHHAHHPRRDDLDRAVAFYRDVVGWTPASVVESTAFFDLDGLILALWPHRDLAAEEGMPGATVGPYRGFAVAYNARSREEVDEVLRGLAERGARIVRPAYETDWGGYSGYFADPDGHHWEVAWNPFWPLGADGRVDFPTG